MKLQVGSNMNTEYLLRYLTSHAPVYSSKLKIEMKRGRNVHKVEPKQLRARSVNFISGSPSLNVKPKYT